MTGSSCGGLLLPVGEGLQMVTRANPWWVSTALLGGVALALVTLLAPRAAFALPGSAPASAPGAGSVPGGGSPPGEESVPGEPGVNVGPVRPGYQLVLEVESARLVDLDTVDVTVTYDCYPYEYEGVTLAPRNIKVRLYAVAYQANGDSDIEGYAAPSDRTCRAGKKNWARMTIELLYDRSGPPSYEYEIGPAIITAYVEAKDLSDTSIWQSGYRWPDIEPVELKAAAQ